MLNEEIGDMDPKKVLREEVEEFLCDFEDSDETEEIMKMLLSIWRDKLVRHAQEIDGHSVSIIKKFVNVCEDYASCRGMLERVRKEVEEIRLYLEM